MKSLSMAMLVAGLASAQHMFPVEGHDGGYEHAHEWASHKPAHIFPNKLDSNRDKDN